MFHEALQNSNKKRELADESASLIIHGKHNLAALFEIMRGINFPHEIVFVMAVVISSALNLITLSFSAPADSGSAQRTDAIYIGDKANQCEVFASVCLVSPVKVQLVNMKTSVKPTSVSVPVD